MANITLKYGDSVFNVITDTLGSGTPCPLVTIATNANKDFDGNLLSYKYDINLEGIILGSSLSGCLGSYSGVVNFFSDNAKQGKSFQILCNGTPIVEYSGAYFLNSNANNSTNNWVTTIPYTVALESYFASDTTNGLIESFDESWTIEPLEEVSYYSRNIATVLYNLSSANSGMNSPPAPKDMNTLSSGITITNYLQYRVSHKISAVGRALMTPSGKSQAYAQASKFVLAKANNAYTSSSSPSGIGIYNVSNGVAGLRLYNHVRTIDSSITAGTYGLTDTWLGLGTGVKYTEDFTWEIQTDSSLVKTVTVQGTVKGLEEANTGFSLFPSTSATGNISGLFQNSFANQTSTNNKYYNAINAYTSGIKPYLYQRASQALASTNRAAVSNQIPWVSVENNPLNIVPVNYTESLNPIAGTVGYNITYNNKPGSWLSGVISSSVTITDTLSADLVSDIFVLGRPLGPILERVGYTKNERRLNLELVYPAPTGFAQANPNDIRCVANKSNPAYQAVTGLIGALKPISPNTAFSAFNGETQSINTSNTGLIYQTSNNKVWNPVEGRLTWDIVWVYNTGCS